MTAPDHITATTPNSSWDQRLLQAVNDDPMVPEVFKALRTRILRPKDGSPPPRTIVITSAAAGEGKSFVTANLGISLAMGMDQFSLLVDCDLRRPKLASFFGIPDQPGLADYLRGTHELAEIIRKTSINRLSLLPSGERPGNPAELLSSQRMRSLVAELADRYDDRLIIFDTPPALSASESAALAGDVDTVYLVVRKGGAGREGILKAIELIGRERIGGLIFNAYTTNIVERTLLAKSVPYGAGY